MGAYSEDDYLQRKIPGLNFLWAASPLMKRGCASLVERAREILADVAQLETKRLFSRHFCDIVRSHVASAQELSSSDFRVKIYKP